jgi:thiamine transport system ATP-binding protein
VLRLERLVADYEGQPVLKGLDLEVATGELLCVLGPSGGGKSTLLRVIAGLETPTGGRVLLEGRDLSGVPPHERGVGLMFQDYALFPHRDVAGNVAFGLRMQGLREEAATARVAELLELVGLPGAGRRPVAQLSGGEQQRVALARALAPRPRLLMLDEPMGSLDRALRERLPEELRAIFGELGLTVIYVTHDHDEALSVADRVVLLDAGRVVADDTPEALWTRPPNAWSARFLGFRNVAPVRVAAGRIETPWGWLPLESAATTPPEGPATVVLRPAALVAAAEAPIRGRVSARRFRGDHVLLIVDVAGAPPLHVEARDDRLPEVGQDVALAVRPGGAHVMPGAEDAAERASALPSRP